MYRGNCPPSLFWFRPGHHTLSALQPAQPRSGAASRQLPELFRLGRRKRSRYPFSRPRLTRTSLRNSEMGFELVECVSGWRMMFLQLRCSMLGTVRARLGPWSRGRPSWQTFPTMIWCLGWLIFFTVLVAKCLFALPTASPVTFSYSHR